MSHTSSFMLKIAPYFALAFTIYAYHASQKKNREYEIFRKRLALRVDMFSVVISNLFNFNIFLKEYMDDPSNKEVTQNLERVVLALRLDEEKVSFFGTDQEIEEYKRFIFLINNNNMTFINNKKINLADSSEEQLFSARIKLLELVKKNLRADLGYNG